MIAHSESYIIEGSDTFIKVPFMRAKIWFEQIARLSAGKFTSDSLLAVRNETIRNGKLKEAELKQGIEKLQLVNEENESQIESLERQVANSRKMWRNRSIYFGAGGLAVGLLTGLIIAR